MCTSMIALSNRHQLSVVLMVVAAAAHDPHDRPAATIIRSTAGAYPPSGDKSGGGVRASPLVRTTDKLSPRPEPTCAPERHPACRQPCDQSKCAPQKDTKHTTCQSQRAFRDGIPSGRFGRLGVKAGASACLSAPSVAPRVLWGDRRARVDTRESPATAGDS